MPNKFYLYLRLMRFDKPIGILLLLWPTLWALWIANSGHPNLNLLIIFIAGVVVMRSAGCIINDIVDRNFDPYVKRTQHRPLADGTLSLKEALAMLCIMAGIALWLALLLPALAFVLAIIGLAITIIYPFMKRYIYWPQFVLGLAFAWGIPMAFAASNVVISLTGWGLFCATIFWIIAYDTQYAMVDKEDDLKIDIKSTAILFGQHDRLFIGLFQFGFLISLLLIANNLNLSNYFYLGWVVALSLIIFQQYLIFTQKPEQCFRAFLNNHWVGLAIFFGFYLGFL